MRVSGVCNCKHKLGLLCAWLCRENITSTILFNSLTKQTYRIGSHEPSSLQERLMFRKWGGQAKVTQGEKGVGSHLICSEATVS